MYSIDFIFLGNSFLQRVDINFGSLLGQLDSLDSTSILGDFFNEGKYIISNKLTTNFIQNFPTTDDIFFWLFFSFE